jgi:hypothetical protein
MTPTANKLIPVALVAALLGGTAGAFITRSSKTTEPSAQTSTVTTPAAQTAGTEMSNGSLDANAADQQTPASEEQTAYRDGFNDGFSAKSEQASKGTSKQTVVYRNSARRSSGTASRAYYDYEQPRKRSFWDKHRDKLTVAMGAGGGALVGGLVGGKKGAAIGALAGGGGSALYTYKIRKRNRNY